MSDNEYDDEGVFDDINPDEFDDDEDADHLFDEIDPDQLISSSAVHKRDREDNEQTTSKRPRPQEGESGPADSSGLAKLELAQRLLRDKFGYDSFRHEQKAAIQRILQGKSALVIFPTGAGKSLCYQIPGIAFQELDKQDGSRGPEESGLTIVVSPLIALMKDQVDALKRRGIPADCMDSTKSWEAQQLIHAALRKGQLRILYCAPERLNNEGFVETMKSVRGGVRLLAVDEAHCISEWGHSFRPEYLKVSRFSKEIGAERVICLTATATPKVARDVCEAFGIDADGVFQTSPYRPNLNLLAAGVKTKQSKYPLLFRFLQDHPGPTLVYVTLQQQAEVLAQDLRDQGFNAAAFHAGMKVEMKTKTQDDFMAGKVPIVVATIAFGMGIDKPDIRNIVHFDLSSSIEEYSQQIGRAGRDGKTSNCMFYICHEDFYLRENFARGDLPSKASLENLLRDIFDSEVVRLKVDDVFKKTQAIQSREFDIRLSPLATIYAALELRFELIRAITPEYTEYKFQASPRYVPAMLADKSPEAKVLLKNAKLAKKWYTVDPTALAQSTGIPRVDFVRKLNYLHDSGIIEMKAGGIEQRYRILKNPPRSSKEIKALVDELHKDLERREQEALNRTQDVYRLIVGDKCFATALAEHFGTVLPNGKERCGHCTHCVSGKRVTMPPPPHKDLDVDGIKRVLAVCSARDDPRFLARVAFGIKSPRVSQLNLHNSKVFGSMADHEFTSLLREFENACKTAAAGPKSSRP